jgi:gamma-glutamyltranspeptidase/glutathione hydrolase
MSAAGESGGRVGPKTPVTGLDAVCASQHPIVTETMLEVMRSGGNAVDAAIAGCLVQATVQQDMTNHAGTITFLMWEASSGKIHELNSMGTIVPDLAPFTRVPQGKGGLYASAMSPYAVVPGFMPGLKALYERFATLAWRDLCEPAIAWAESGHEVGSFEHLVMAQTADFYLYTPSGREHFAPGGHLPQVGDTLALPELAKTLRRLADEGPDEFITGEWARRFVTRANELGWPIELHHLAAVPPRWGHGLRYRHRNAEIVQLSAPERQAVFCALVLGVLDHLDITSLGHYTASAETLYYFGHALRRASYETGSVNDPAVFDDPSDSLLSSDLHAHFADLLRKSKPKIDLSRHIELTTGPNALRAAGATPTQPAGSCELTLVDQQGNWVQMMNTLQSGGIPGEVVGGVPMVGSHGMTSLASPIGGWFTGGGRMRSVIGNTIVLEDGKPIWSLGSPGNVHCTVPQVLSNVLDFGMDPYDGEDTPRMLPLDDDYTLPIESRIPAEVVGDLAKLGVLVDPLPAYDYHMGSFQMSWRGSNGELRATSGPRRAGSAAAL